MHTILKPNQEIKILCIEGYFNLLTQSAEKGNHNRHNQEESKNTKKAKNGKNRNR